MNIKILIDMNLSPRWMEHFKINGIESVHWSSLGDPRAEDDVLMQWARENKHVVFTHDLDFGTILALTQATAPSVLQIRTQNVLPENLGKLVVDVLKKYHVELEKGALVVVDEIIQRVRMLPF